MEDNNTPDRIRLGKSGIFIPLLGAGTWAWGDRFYWGFGRGDYGEVDIQSAYQRFLDGGINFFDSAEIYGSGASERYLGDFAREAAGDLILATKFFPYPWRWRKGDLERALQRSLRRLGREQVDLYQIHWPYPPRSIETWVAALGAAARKGYTRAVGVSNYNLEQMTRSVKILEDHGIPLASNQVEYNLLERSAEHSGLLAACQDLDITVIAYSPLASGVLTGKYHASRAPRGPRGRRYNPAYLERIQPALDRIRRIGEKYGGKTPAQVALNWVICKGAVPIPGAKTRDQADENCGALGWRLSTEDVAALDSLPLNIH